MEQVPLGRTARTVSRIALGTTTFGREIDEDETRRILDYAVEHGLTLLDTAEAYGGGNARMYRRDVMGVQDVREATGEVSSSERMIRDLDSRTWHGRCGDGAHQGVEWQFAGEHRNAP